MIRFVSRWWILAGMMFGVSSSASGAIQKEAIDYQYDGVTFKGLLVFDDSVTGPRPGVLVVHEWWGLNEYAKGRAEALAKLGYTAFACDMYGNGQVTDHPKDAGAMASDVRKNVTVWQGRAKAALNVLQKHPTVKPDQLAAIGYCFGGSTALQLAYSGAPLKAVVTFHAALPTPSAEQARAIQPKILINHGADDFFIPAKSIEDFKTALETAKKPFEFLSFPGAVHSFTVAGAEKLNIKGMAYQEAADAQSWAAMRKLFSEVFR